MALPPSTANWHWKNKNVTKWGKEWFERELVNLTVTGDKEGEELRISAIMDIEGDIELGQRKSKYVNHIRLFPGYMGLTIESAAT